MKIAFAVLAFALAVSAPAPLASAPDDTAQVCQEVAPPPAPVEYRVPHVIMDVPVTEEVSQALVGLIGAVNEAQMDAMVLEINSPGGSVDAGFKIAKAIEMSRVPVICIVDGDAASMAFYILQACEVRMMTDRSVLMAHEPAAYAMGFGGQQDDWKTKGENTANALKALAKAMNRHMARRLFISFDKFSDKISHGKEWWLEADEAYGVGAVDYVVDGIPRAEAIIKALLRDHYFGL